METGLLKSIIYNQQKIIENEQIVPRDYFFEPNDNYILVGMRRAGKTTLMHKIVQDLIKKGIDWNQIIYINFEDERLREMTVDDLNNITIVANEMNDKKSYYFFDEIQNIDGWERFARRMADQHERVYITGSNSKMMSSEIISRLGGRYMMQYITPYNFDEYLTAKNIAHDERAMYITSSLAKIRSEVNSYLHDGGLPESLQQVDARTYLTNIYQDIYLGDIIKRNSVRNKKSLSLLINKIAQTVMHEISYTSLTKAIKNTGNPISTPVTINYVDFAKEAFLLFDIKNYVLKFSERESIPKFYFLDNGILNLFLFHKDPALLENLVAITLYNKCKDDVYYLHSPKTKIDIDFYLPEHSKAIQVTWDLSETDKKREIGNLAKLHQTNPEIKDLIIVTAEDEDEIQVGDCKIQVIPVYKFLLKN